MLLCRSELSVPHSSVHLAKVGAIDAHVEGSGKRYAQHGTAARAASTWPRCICPEKKKTGFNFLFFVFFLRARTLALFFPVHVQRGWYAISRRRLCQLQGVHNLLSNWEQK